MYERMIFVSYEMFRNSLLTRLTDKLPAKLLNDVMCEVDMLSQDFSFERACTDLITVEDVPEVVKAFIASMAVRNCSTQTLKDYRGVLLRFFQKVSKPFTSVTANDIRCYLFQSQAERNWAATSVEHNRTVIAALFTWLVDNEYLSRNPAKNIRPTKLPKKKLPPLKQIELEEFRNACITPREKALVDFLFATGCRVSEAAAMMITDIDWRECSALVRHGKGDKQRTVYFNAEAELSMKKYLDSINWRGDGHLFTKTRAPYTGVSREALEMEVRKIRNRIPDKLSFKVVPHSFRRTMGTTAVSRGCPIEKVKELMGHESLDTTMHYVTQTQTDVHRAHEQYLGG